MGPHSITVGAPTGLSLLVEPPSGECLHVQVTRNPFVLGRLAECDLALRDSRISRRHARIRFEAGIYSIEDLQSRNGITVNGERVERSGLTVGDRIGFGVADSFVITVVEDARPQAPLLKKVADIATERGQASSLGRLAAMLEVARTITSSEGLDEVFGAVTEAVLAITGAERAFLLLRDEGDPTGELRVRAARGTAGSLQAAEASDIPRRAIGRALDRRTDLFAVSVPELADSAAGGSASGSPSSALCVPILRIRMGPDHETTVLSAKRHTLGALYMDGGDPDAQLAEGNQEILQALAIGVSTVLENARLINEETEKRRIDQELQIAHGIQQALRPAALPAEGWLVAKGHSESRLQLGGDYYDLMPVAEGRFAAVVADVSGKGVAASLLASLLQGAFFLGAGPDLALPGTLRRINRYLCERSAGTRFVTVLALTVDDRGNVRWSNAGHCSAILVRATGAVELLNPNSRPLGLFEDAEFVEESCRLRPGDKLVMYSDGISEARNAEGAQLGERRLERAAAQLAGQRTVDFFNALLAAVREFVGEGSFHDDVTLLVLGFQES